MTTERVTNEEENSQLKPGLEDIPSEHVESDIKSVSQWVSAIALIGILSVGCVTKLEPPVCSPCVYITRGNNRKLIKRKCFVTNKKGWEFSQRDEQIRIFLQDAMEKLTELFRQIEGSASAWTHILLHNPKNAFYKAKVKQHIQSLTYIQNEIKKLIKKYPYYKYLFYNLEFEVEGLKGKLKPFIK